MKNPTFPENTNEIPGIFFKSIKKITLFGKPKDYHTQVDPVGASTNPHQVYNDLGIDYIGN